MNTKRTPTPRKRHTDTLTKKATTHTVKKITPTEFYPLPCYTVTSGESGSEYIVQLREDGTAGCNCKFATKGDTYQPWERAVTCTHTTAVFQYRAKYAGRKIKLLTGDDLKKYQHNKRLEHPDDITIVSIKKR